MNKYFISVILITLNFSFVKSQSYKLYYNLELIKDTIAKNVEKRNMVLWTEKQNYIFCSEEVLLKDSIKSNNFEDPQYLMDDDVEFMKVKKANIISSFSLIDQNLYVINENFDVLNWQLKSQTKNINNIECQLATLQYKGRDWEAWFSTKYPITFGPYIFNGLPGAIIELSDTKRQYIFKLSKIKNTKEDLNKLINQKVWVDNKPIFITKKQLQRVYLSNYSNPFKRMKEKQIIYMIDEKTGEHQPPPDFDRMALKAQKYIRENNNPIEISEAVKY
ncbi:GLPGLI family protein [Chryseobacterium sp. FH2]|uniref:GLPGLI family protein n=1 Tax=Chryseobacterium sp. FH2 TaxID=1674291 RepID=UPI00065AD310|nr:GLPGLI family protein [Chryseobacterium sp. FH2]